MKHEQQVLDDSILASLIARSKGSARTALHLLEAVLTSKDVDTQMEILGVSAMEQEEKVEFLAVALVNKNRDWKTLSKILTSIEERDVETVRRQVLTYCCKVLLGNSPLRGKAYLVIRAFEESWNQSGKAGLVAAVWESHRE